MENQPSTNSNTDSVDLTDRRSASMNMRGAAVWAMAGQYVSFALQFISSVIVSRFFLEPSEVGLFSIALAAAMMISILQDFGLTRYLSGHPSLTEQELKVCTSLSVLLSLAIALSVVAIAWPVAQFYDEPRLFPILGMIALSYLFVPLSAVPTALLSRDLNFKGLFMVNASGALVNSALAILLAWKGFSAESLAIAMIGQAAVRAAIAQMLRPVPIPLAPRLKGAREALKFGAGSTVLCVSGSLGVRSPDLIVGHMLGLAMAGLYSRSSALGAQLHMLVVGAIGSIFYPAFARLRDEGEALGPHYERIVSGYGAVVWPAMALLAVLAEPVIMTLYGPVWRDAAPLLVWMALGEICFVMLPLHIDLPILMGQMRRVIYYNLFDTAAAAGTLIIFSHWGIEAAAMSRLAYGVLWVCVYARFMHQVAGFDWSRMLMIYARSAAVTLITVTPILTALHFWRSADQLGFAELALFGLVAAPCWLAALYLVKHPARKELVSMILHILPASMQRRLGTSA